MARLRLRVLGIAALVVWAGTSCSRQEPAPAASQAVGATKPAPAATSAADADVDGEDDDDEPTASPAVAKPISAAAAGEQAGEGKDEVVEAEEKEADPLSKTVKVTVSVEPALKTVRITWGRKNLGGPKIEIERPRNSGPLDLTIKAPNFLPYHTRLHTERDDKVRVRLYTEGTAVGLLGYRAPKSEAPDAGAPDDNGLPPIPKATVAKPKVPGPLP